MRYNHITMNNIVHEREVF